MVSSVALSSRDSIKYRWLVMEHSVEIYGAIAATVFDIFGVWLGLKLTQRNQAVEVRGIMVATPVEFVRNQEKLESFGITPRESEVLQLIDLDNVVGGSIKLGHAFLVGLLITAAAAICYVVT